jgi:hypothetical protein
MPKKSTGASIARKLFESRKNPKTLRLSEADLAMLLNETIKYADKTAMYFIGEEIDAFIGGGKRK